MQPPTTQPPATPTFFRSSDRIIGGVCSGLAEGFHVETLWVRLAFVVLAFLNGVGVLLYVVLWVLMPERAGYRPPGQNVVESMGNDMKRAWADLKAQFGGSRATAPQGSATAGVEPPAGGAPATATGELATVSAPPAGPMSRNPGFILGAILVVIGVAFLAANTGFVDWSILWPAALVAVGVGLLIRNLQKRA
jgi:phage shock protein C